MSYQRFDTPGMAPRDRFEYWRTWYSQAVDAPMRLESIGEPPADFRAAAEVISCGDIDIVEMRCGPATGQWTREGVAPADRLRLVILAPTPHGAGFWHGRDLSLDGGAVALLGRTQGRWRCPDGLRGIQVNVPRPAITVTDAQLDSINDPRLLRGDRIFASLTRPVLTGLGGHLREVSGADTTELASLWISMLIMLVRSLTGADTGGTDTAGARRLQARRYIRANLADPRLSPAAVAQALHVSRRTLYSALSPSGVAAEIRRQRLERAQAMLLDPAQARPIAEIGAAVGIPDAAVFSRSFRTHYGLSPTDLRATSTAPAPRRAR
jgi:AraC-like DNA-binding protein